MSRVAGPEKSGGIEVFSGFVQEGGRIFMELDFTNVSTGEDISTFAIQLNKNAFGLSPANQQVIFQPAISPGATGTTRVEMAVNPGMQVPTPSGQNANPQIQVAIKNLHTNNVFYFAVNCNFECLFTADGEMEKTAFIESWKSIDDRHELYATVSDLPADSTSIESVQQKFAAYNIFFIARRPVPNAEGQEVVYFSMKTVNGMTFFAELTFKRGVNAAKVCLKTEASAYGGLAKSALEALLRGDE